MGPAEGGATSEAVVVVTLGAAPSGVREEVALTLTAAGGRTTVMAMGTAPVAVAAAAAVAATSDPGRHCLGINLVISIIRFSVIVI